MSAMRKPTLIILVALACLVTLHDLAAAQKSELKFKVPAGWVEEERTSTMRVAQYRLPKVEGDTEDASLVLYYFGQGQGGSTAANIERWIGQMKQPDGSAVKDAKQITFETGGLKMTTVDVSGTYVAETAPGSGTFFNKPGSRLRAAVVETPKGFYYVKLVGPEKTVAQWNESFLGYIKSFEFK
jgi:predicted dehydrogenase